MKPTLSVCMIIKDEEKFLGRCLDSIYGIADEIIVVDTGSQDQSKEIALRYTDKVFDFEWVNDFSKARNYAASKATGEWIFAIDADEFVERNSLEKLKTKLKGKPPKENIFGVQIVSFVGLNGESTSLNFHERLYRNNGAISYYRSVHELLAHKDSKESNGILDFQLYHSGYLTDVINNKDKSERNLTLLLNKKEKDPIDYFFIGNEYRNKGDFNRAIKHYQKAYKLKPHINLDWVKKLLLYMADSLHRDKRDTEALEIIESCEEVYSNIADFKVFKGIILFNNKKLKQSKKVFENILLQKGNLVSDESIDFLELLPHRYLGEIYEKENELHKAVQSYSKALSLNEADDDLWSKLIYLLAKHSTMEELAIFLNNNVTNKKGITPQRVVKILLAVPILEVQRLSRSLLNESELSSLENEALLIKNLHLDNQVDDVMEILKEKSENGIVNILATGVYTIVDLILLAKETGSAKYQEMLLTMKVDKSLENLLNMLFNNKNKKLSSLEENFFISIYKQASVLDINEVVNTLKSRKVFLSKQAKHRINEINFNIS
ncbi:glycosyl transferase [Oceanobacillus picturae]|uniref:Glycosyl transferase n=1 Tax=Oceanobacillus picturae TaxID=171693 RepID=A0A0U9H4K5_9BACI|nr:glycosyltransferase family 2 protein [Oceanobacillus picturae]GAQ16225.1 glycosyl transferase [Oceanobacillus picturae]